MSTPGSVDGPVRFGIVGTGYWARAVHAPGVAGHAQADVVAVWGRDAERAADLAAEHDAEGFTDFDAMLGTVDALAFAVPPDVQAPLAVRAAQAGKHLLLEKPVALDAATADEVAAAVASAGIASVVFFTERFVPERERWLQGLAAFDCLGGRADWLASLRTPGNPFAGSAWRQESGALWDVGPHALSVLLPVLGPVVSVAGAPGRDDLVHLVLTHESGATSTAHLSLTMPPDATRSGLSFYDNTGWHERPDVDSDPVEVHTGAVGELVEMVRDGRTEHRCDAAFGAEVVRVLAQAQNVLRH